MSRSYFVPDYYPGFVCKCGSCRNSCCRGWPVIITGEEYTRLMEADSSREFRSKLEAAMNLDGDPKRGGTAHIVHDRNGRCPLMGEDGLCTLQLELGEAILPDVCRLYPRNTREVCGEAECACAASCERVTELLLEHEGPLGFLTMELDEEPRFPIDMKESFFRECRQSLELFQGSGSLEERFSRLNEALFRQKPGDESSRNGIHMLFAMVSYFAKNSPVVGAVCRRTMEAYGMAEKKVLEEDEASALEERYALARKAGRMVLPDWELGLTNLLLNTMFYNSFPHVGGTNGEVDPFLSLCTTAAFVDFIHMGCLMNGGSREDAVDVVSTLFRLIEHSDFKYRAVKYYRDYLDREPGAWTGLIYRICN